MLQKCKKFKLTEDDQQINITAIAVGGKREKKKEREREKEREDATESTRLAIATTA